MLYAIDNMLYLSYNRWLAVSIPMRGKMYKMNTNSLEAVISLDFQGTRVRFVGTPDNPAWVAQDVCDALDIENARQAIANFDEEERGVCVCNVYGTFGRRELATVYEPGLYKLIMRSRKPEAFPTMGFQGGSAQHP